LIRTSCALNVVEHLKSAALTYARAWGLCRPELFLRCYPNSDANIPHIHVIDVGHESAKQRLGIWELPVEDALTVLREEAGYKMHVPAVASQTPSIVHPTALRDLLHGTSQDSTPVIKSTSSVVQIPDQSLIEGLQDVHNKRTVLQRKIQQAISALSEYGFSPELDSYTGQCPVCGQSLPICPGCEQRVPQAVT